MLYGCFSTASSDLMVVSKDYTKLQTKYDDHYAKTKEEIRQKYERITELENEKKKMNDEYSTFNERYEAK